jgi:hypothetical protein
MNTTANALRRIDVPQCRAWLDSIREVGAFFGRHL